MRDDREWYDRQTEKSILSLIYEVEIENRAYLKRISTVATVLLVLTLIATALYLLVAVLR